VKHVPLLALAMFVAACGGQVEPTDEPRSSGETTPASSTVPVEQATQTPPKILLRSAVGDQEAVRGSSCVNSSARGTGVCADSGPVYPEAVTVALDGDEVTFVFEGARIVRPSGCHSDDDQGCLGYVHVRPLGCDDRQVARLPLTRGPETRWTIDLERGAYQLDVFGYFETDAGTSGDVSGTLGLVVGGGPKEYDALGVTEVKPSMQVCPFAA
jgi:hypothetical protein